VFVIFLPIRFTFVDDCCRKRCYPHEKCGHNIEGCETNEDCTSGLACLGTGFCYDTDECKIDTGLDYCATAATCSNTIGSFLCTCHQGYINHVANVGCSDLDECATNQYPKCMTNSECRNTIGNYLCVCQVGYNGDPYVGCIDINECIIGMYVYFYSLKKHVHMN
jgi:hypothetical protein